MTLITICTACEMEKRRPEIGHMRAKFRPSFPNWQCDFTTSEHADPRRVPEACLWTIDACGLSWAALDKRSWFRHSVALSDRLYCYDRECKVSITVIDSTT